MRIVNGRVFHGEGFAEETLFVSGGRFVDEASWEDDGCTIDAEGQVVAPGLIDLHFHGCMGHDLCDGTAEALCALARYEASQGITAICPATMTFPEEILGKVMDVAANWHPAQDQAQLVGLNMEGPFISPNKVGAQNPAYVHAADVDMFLRLQERAKGLVKLVDIACEEPGALDFIERLASQVRISLAHTTASYEQARAAFDAGACHLTHLFNAMPGLHHRDPGPIAAGAECPQAMAEIICDGIHIAPAMVRLAFSLFGPERMILISDTMEAAGLEDGEYSLGGQAVTVKGNRATLHDGTIAGSNTNLAQCLRIAVTQMGIPLEWALKAASANPAKALGIFHERGDIAPGKIADCIFLDEKHQVTQVLLRGNKLSKTVA